jgi:hypothetical protein
MVDMKIGLLSFIDIYSGGGIKVVIRRKISGGKFVSHANYCTVGYQLKEKASHNSACPFSFKLLLTLKDRGS